MSKRTPLDANTLAQFTGPQNFYRHGLMREVLYTEGAQYVADTAGALLACGDGNGREVYSKSVPFTDRAQSCRTTQPVTGTATFHIHRGNRHILALINGS